MASNTNVVFGTGPVGLAVIEELVKRGAAVTAVNRSGRAGLPEGVPLAAGDATDPAFTTRVCSGAEVIYNCLNAPYTRWPQEFPPLQAAVLKAAESTGAKLVAMENLYMYGPTHGKPLTEDLPHNATGRKGNTRAAMSRELFNAHREGRVRVTVGRASDFFGPRARESAAGERLFEAAVQGKRVQLIGDPGTLHSYSYVPDIARGLVTLGNEDRALGFAWHLPNAPAVSSEAFARMAFQAAGKPARIRRVGTTLLAAAGLFSPTVRELREMLYEFEGPFVVDDSRLRATFGVEATPLPEAIAATVTWFTAQGGR